MTNENTPYEVRTCKRCGKQFAAAVGSNQEYCGCQTLEQAPNEITPDEALTMLDILHVYLDENLSERGKQLFEYLNDIIRRVSSGELAPVVHAKWSIASKEYVSCSHCRCDTALKDVHGFPIGRNSLADVGPVYCPHCGALMDGKDDSHE